MDNKITEFMKVASQCTLCRKKKLIHQEEDGLWSYPLFHQGSEWTSQIIFVSEAPNWEDTFHPQKGRLTVEKDTDPTGAFLWELLQDIGLEPKDVLFTNSVLCLPARKNASYPVQAAQRDLCRPLLGTLIETYEAKIVVTLGNQALHAVGKIQKHGLVLKNNVGTIHDWWGRKLLPLYHPSLLGRVTRSKEQQKQDFLVLKAHI